jgi:hypothetical protein
MGESLCTAIQNGLGMNETLQSLELHRFHLCNDNADLWSRAFSFLRTNKALKSLIIRSKDMTRSCAPAFHIDIAAMLQENMSLESLSLQNWYCTTIKAKDYVVLVSILQHNKSLKSLNLKDRRDLT